MALGFGLRLEAALSPDVDPGAATIVAYQGNDSKSYGEIAQSLYETGRYGTPEMRNPTDWSPGAPILYAGIYYVTGGVHEEFARAVVAFLGALMVLIVYLLGRRLAGPGRGNLCRAAGRDLSRVHRQRGAVPVRADRRLHAVRRRAGNVLGGRSGAHHVGVAAAGRAAGRHRADAARVPHVRGNPGLVVLVKMARDRGIRLGIASVALFVAAFVLVLAPWTIRNFIVLDKFVPVTTGGGKALFVATYLPGDGRQLRVKRELIRRFEHKQEVTDREVADTQMKDLLDKVARKYPDLERDAALAKIGRENFRKYVREEPVEYAQMVVTKMWNVWRRGSGPTMRASGWIVFHYAILALAVLGLVVLALRRRWEVIVIGLLILGITVLGGLLLAVPRRNVPLMPLVLTLAACGGAWLSLTVGAWLAERRSRDRPVRGRVREA